jgi:hypothetical protein
MNHADSPANSDSNVRARLLDAATQTAAELNWDTTPDFSWEELEEDDPGQTFPVRKLSEAIEVPLGATEGLAPEPSLPARPSPGLSDQPVEPAGAASHCCVERPAGPAESIREVQTIGWREAVQAVATLPGWLSILLGGAFAILLYCKSLDYLLAENSERRAIWGTVLLSAGLLILCLCQLWAFLKLLPENAGWGITEAMVPSLPVWCAAFRRLPHTRWPIWLAGWSLTMVLASTLVVGGQTYWLGKKPAETVPWAGTP